MANQFEIIVLGFEPREVNIVKNHRSYYEVDTSKVKDGCFINTDTMLFSKKTMFVKGTKKSDLQWCPPCLRIKGE